MYIILSLSGKHVSIYIFLLPCMCQKFVYRIHTYVYVLFVLKYSKLNTIRLKQISEVSKLLKLLHEAGIYKFALPSKTSMDRHELIIYWVAFHQIGNGMYHQINKNLFDVLLFHLCVCVHVDILCMHIEER